MLNRFLRNISLISGVLALTACGPKEVKTEVSLSANRIMGYAIRTDANDSQMPAIIEKSLAATYGAQLIRLNFASKSVVEDPENLYLIGSNRIDDLFIFSLVESTGAVETNATIYNGGNLKTVAMIKFSVPREGKEPFTDRYTSTFRRVATETFPNPNIYPKSEPLHYANLLYVYSQEYEKNLSEPLTCDNAPQHLHYYGKAKTLYEMSKDSLAARSAVGSQEKAHQLTTRLQEATDKSQILEKCRNDANLAFAMNWQFGKIDPANHDAILRAASNAGLEDIFKQYTTKPVSLRFQLSDTGELSLLVTMRFDQARYLAWTKNRIPQKIRNYNILSLDPYYALLQKLVVFRASLPAEAASTLKASFSQMKMSLSLDTILNGSLLMGVDGKYESKNKSIAMAYPNSVILQVPGFESKTISGRDREIFQEKSWMALSNCKTLDGTMTEDGLLMRFFGLPCT